MLMMKACPRCSGDLIRTRDPHDDEAMFSCVQCGHASYRPIAVLTTAEVEAKHEAAAAVATSSSLAAASTGRLTRGVRARLAARRLAARQPSQPATEAA